MTQKWFFKTKNQKNWFNSSKTEREKREKTEITSIRNETENIIPNATDIKKTIRKYYKQLYIHKHDILEDIDQFLKMHKLSPFTQYEIDNWKIWIAL